MVAGTDTQTSIHMSSMMFDRSPAAVVVARRIEDESVLVDADLAAASSAAAGLHVPVLVVSPSGSDAAEVTAELERLEVETVIGYGDPAADWEALAAQRALVAGPTSAAGFEKVLGLAVSPVPVEADVVASVRELGGPDPRLLTLEPATTPPAPEPSPGASATGAPSAGLAELATAAEVPDFTPAAQPIQALVLATPSSALAPLVTARAAGADVELATEPDPRATGRTVDAVRSHADRAILAVGDAFGSEQIFAERVRVAATAAQLPGGGQTVFPGRRMVALYGHPSGPYLGALGEQDIEATLARVKDLAAQYQPFSDEPVVPALDLIATVASADPGADGDYSSETSIDQLEPWIDAAEEQGVYVVLDLQSGRSDFLSQAKLYEELLARPSVGLALDPEWRLLPGQQPLEQIGTVSAAEINAASTWLANLTRDRALPQKLLMIHQFRIDMISEREDLDVSRTELAVTLHADGHGTPAQKLDTWFALQSVPPEGTWPSWKNFYDEDQPMLTPEQTYTLIDPKPWLVTYQ
ncbi:serine/threonine-protein kinase [Arthrobacter sp. MDT2-2]